MKKLLAVAALATLTLASCTNDNDLTGNEVTPPSEQVPVEFSTYMGRQANTRAANGYTGAIDTDALKNAEKANGFGVFAYYTENTDYTATQTTYTPNFMYDEHVTYTSSGNTWTAATTKYWPNDNTVADNTTNNAVGETPAGKVSFFAYAPWVAMKSATDWTTYASTATNTGIVGMSANTATGAPTITYRLDTNSENVDLLWGTTGTNGSTTNSTTAQAGKAIEGILPGYTVNADLTKMKTNGKVSFAFKHALAKVGGTGTGKGLQVQLDIDKDGEITGGGDDTNTKVLIKEIVIDKAGDTDADKFNTEGTLNLATGQWSDLKTLGTIKQTISNDTGADNVIAESLREPTTTVADGADAWTNLPTGVTKTATNVFASEKYPLLFIPGTTPKFKITITYIVRTKDGQLAKGYSQVTQKISNILTFSSAVELNKQYNIIMHLGITSVKFDATVSDWVEYVDGEGNTVNQEIHLPINVKETGD